MRAIGVFLVFIIVLGCAERSPKRLAPTLGQVRLHTEQRNYKAGVPISLNFLETGFDTPLRLLLTNTFGSALIHGVRSGEMVTYAFPKNFYRTSGRCEWQLLYLGREMAKGVVQIEPSVPEKPHLETYFGPRSVIAGETDFSMLVVVPTDAYDNPLPNGTQTRIRAQFQDNIEENKVPTKDFIAWKNIYSKTKTGRILVGASCMETDSKELTTIIHPTLSEDFEIRAERNHNFADGNQIVRFFTDQLRDRYGNIVADGTLVDFMVVDSKGALLRTIGTTVNGMANANMLHPSKKEQWQITAYVTGAAKSNTISLSFAPAIAHLPIVLSEGGREVRVGPILSFMEQRVPDGIEIKMAVNTSEGELMMERQTTSKNGMGIFLLEKAYFNTGTYRVTITAAGHTETISIQLDENE